MKKINQFVGVFSAIFLAACSQKPIETQQNSTRLNQETTAVSVAKDRITNAKISSEERLGTSWGDDIQSQVTEVDLRRLSNKPVAEVLLRYANKDFQGRAVNSIALNAGKISLSVVDDRGHGLALYRADQQYFLAGKNGQSYQLRYENHTGKTFEVVASVDGLDVINGRAASRHNAGYVLEPYNTLDIEGFRKSNDAVASFTFSQPKDAYAANSVSGSVQNTGIIGSVIYELKVPEVKQRSNNQYAPAPNAFPADR